MKFVDLRVSDDLTGHVKVKTFGHSLWVGLASKIIDIKRMESQYIGMNRVSDTS